MIQTPHRRYQTAIKPLHMKLGIIADQERLAAEGCLGPILQKRWDTWNEERRLIYRQICIAAIELDLSLQKMEKLSKDLVKKHQLSPEEGERICYFLESGWSEEDVEQEICKMQELTLMYR